MIKCSQASYSYGSRDYSSKISSSPTAKLAAKETVSAWQHNKVLW